MTTNTHHGTRLIFWFILLATDIGLTGCHEAPSTPEKSAVSSPALSVSVIQPAHQDIPLILNANGSVAAWQEAIIGAEISDLRLSEIDAQVGETVRKGQLLAVFASDTVQVDLANSQALLAEAEANLEEASLNGDRARRINSSGSGAMSAQQIAQYLSAEKAARAKVEAAKAQLELQRLRLKHTRVIASDDGVISSRSATLGAVATPGQELFRLIRQNRLEWRGEVTAAELARLRPGLPVAVEVPNVGSVQGVIRQLAPMLDTQSRNGLVYVDLPHAAQQGLRAGMFARGEFNLGTAPALTVPQTAVSLREGFSYVFRLGEQNGDQSKIHQVKVQLGRRHGDSLEILSGVAASDHLVTSGVAFLADGDTVRVVP